MRRHTMTMLLIVAWLPASSLAAVTGDYSDCLTDLKSVQSRWDDLEAGTDLAESTKDAVGAMIDTLVEWLELGPDAEELEVDDEAIMNAAAQLFGAAFGMSVNSLLMSGEAHDVSSDMESVARRIFDKAETAHVLAQPIELSPERVSRAWRWLVAFGECTVRLSSTHSNPNSAVRFAEFDIKALAAPSGGTFTWAFVGLTETDVTDNRPYSNPTPATIGGVAVFQTSQAMPTTPGEALGDASFDGEALPIQSATEGVFGLEFNQQIIKGAGLSSPLPPLPDGMRAISVAVRYDAPNETSCYDDLWISLSQNTGEPDIDHFMSGQVRHRLLEEELWK